MTESARTMDSDARGAGELPDDAQLPEGVWAAFRKDVDSGVTDALILAARHGVSQDRAAGLVRTMQMSPRYSREYRPKSAWKGRRQF